MKFVVLLLESSATSERQRRGGDRCRAEAETKLEDQSREKSSAEREKS